MGSFEFGVGRDKVKELFGCAVQIGAVFHICATDQLEAPVPEKCPQRCPLRCPKRLPE